MDGSLYDLLHDWLALGETVAIVPGTQPGGLFELRARTRDALGYWIDWDKVTW